MQAAGNLMNQYGNMQSTALNAQPFMYQQPQQQQLGAFPNMMNAWAQGGFGGGQNAMKNLMNLLSGMQGDSSLPNGSMSKQQFGM
jgi:hypothetical protein